HLHGVGVAELLLQGRPDLLAVALLEPRGGHGGLLGGRRHHRSLPERTDTRMRCVLRRPSRSTVSTLVRIRVGFLVSGSTIATLLTWIGASLTWMPPVFTPRWSPALVCTVTRLTPSTSTRLVSGYTSMTRPCLPRSPPLAWLRPAMTCTRSFFLIFIFAISQITSGASETIFMNLLSRSSRPTGPKMRVPRGSPSFLRMTAAFSSNLM